MWTNEEIYDYLVNFLRLEYATAEYRSQEVHLRTILKLAENVKPTELSPAHVLYILQRLCNAMHTPKCPRSAKILLERAQQLVETYNESNMGDTINNTSASGDCPNAPIQPNAGDLQEDSNLRLIHDNYHRTDIKTLMDNNMNHESIESIYETPKHTSSSSDSSLKELFCSNIPLSETYSRASLGEPMANAQVSAAIKNALQNCVAEYEFQTATLKLKPEECTLSVCADETTDIFSNQRLTDNTQLVTKTRSLLEVFTPGNQPSTSSAFTHDAEVPRVHGFAPETFQRNAHININPNTQILPLCTRNSTAGNSPDPPTKPINPGPSTSKSMMVLVEPQFEIFTRKPRARRQKHNTQARMKYSSSSSTCDSLSELEFTSLPTVLNTSAVVDTKDSASNEINERQLQRLDQQIANNVTGEGSSMNQFWERVLQQLAIDYPPLNEPQYCARSYQSTNARNKQQIQFHIMESLAKSMKYEQLPRNPRTADLQPSTPKMLRLQIKQKDTKSRSKTNEYSDSGDERRRAGTPTLTAEQTDSILTIPSIFRQEMNPLPISEVRKDRLALIDKLTDALDVPKKLFSAELRSSQSSDDSESMFPVSPRTKKSKTEISPATKFRLEVMAQVKAALNAPNDSINQHRDTVVSKSAFDSTVGTIEEIQFKNHDIIKSKRLKLMRKIRENLNSSSYWSTEELEKDIKLPPNRKQENVTMSPSKRRFCTNTINKLRRVLKKKPGEVFLEPSESSTLSISTSDENDETPTLNLPKQPTEIPSPTPMTLSQTDITPKPTYENRSNTKTLNASPTPGKCVSNKLQDVSNKYGELVLKHSESSSSSSSIRSEPRKRNLYIPKRLIKRSHASSVNRTKPTNGKVSNNSSSGDSSRKRLVLTKKIRKTLEKVIDSSSCSESSSSTSRPWHANRNLRRYNNNLTKYLSPKLQTKYPSTTALPVCETLVPSTSSIQNAIAKTDTLSHPPLIIQNPQDLRDVIESTIEYLNATVVSTFSQEDLKWCMIFNEISRAQDEAKVVEKTATGHELENTIEPATNQLCHPVREYISKRPSIEFRPKPKPACPVQRPPTSLTKGHLKNLRIGLRNLRRMDRNVNPAILVPKLVKDYRRLIKQCESLVVDPADLPETTEPMSYQDWWKLLHSGNADPPEATSRTQTDTLVQKMALEQKYTFTGKYPVEVVYPTTAICSPQTMVKKGDSTGSTESDYMGPACLFRGPLIDAETSMNISCSSCSTHSSELRDIEELLTQEFSSTDTCEGVPQWLLPFVPGELLDNILNKKVIYSWWLEQKMVPADIIKYRARVLRDIWNVLGNFENKDILANLCVPITQAQLIRELLEAFIAPTETFLFHIDENGRVRSTGYRSIVGLHPQTFDDIMVPAVKAINSVVLLRKFVKSLTVQDSNCWKLPPLTYIYYALGIQDTLDPMLWFISSIQRDVKETDTFVDFSIFRRLLLPVWENIILLQAIHHRCVLNFKTNANHVCASNLLSELFKSIERNREDSVYTCIALALYLFAIQPFLAITEHWLTSGFLVDTRDEFILLDENKKAAESIILGLENGSLMGTIWDVSAVPFGISEFYSATGWYSHRRNIFDLENMWQLRRRTSSDAGASMSDDSDIDSVDMYKDDPQTSFPILLAAISEKALTRFSCRGVDPVFSRRIHDASMLDSPRPEDKIELSLYTGPPKELLSNVNSARKIVPGTPQRQTRFNIKDWFKLSSSESTTTSDTSIEESQMGKIAIKLNAPPKRGHPMKKPSKKNRLLPPDAKNNEVAKFVMRSRVRVFLESWKSSNRRRIDSITASTSASANQATTSSVDKKGVILRGINDWDKDLDEWYDCCSNQDDPPKPDTPKQSTNGRHAVGTSTSLSTLGKEFWHYEPATSTVPLPTYCRKVEVPSSVSSEVDVGPDNLCKELRSRIIPPRKNRKRVNFRNDTSDVGNTKSTIALTKPTAMTELSEIKSGNSRLVYKYMWTHQNAAARVNQFATDSEILDAYAPCIPLGVVRNSLTHLISEDRHLIHRSLDPTPKRASQPYTPLDGMMDVFERKILLIGKTIHLVNTMKRCENRLATWESTGETMADEFVRNCMNEVNELKIIILTYFPGFNWKPKVEDILLKPHFAPVFARRSPRDSPLASARFTGGNFVSPTCASGFGDYICEENLTGKTYVVRSLCSRLLQNDIKVVCKTIEHMPQILANMVDRRYQMAQFLVRDILCDEYKLKEYIGAARVVFMFEHNYTKKFLDSVEIYMKEPKYWTENSILNRGLFYILQEKYSHQLEYWKIVLKAGMPCTNFDIINKITVNFIRSWPLTIVMDEYCLEMYNDIFNLRLKLKYAIRKINSLTSDDIGKKSQSTLKKTLVLIRSIFVNLLRYMDKFVSSNGMYDADSILQQAISKAETIESIYMAHFQYVRFMKYYVACLCDTYDGISGFAEICNLAKDFAEVWNSVFYPMDTRGLMPDSVDILSVVTHLRVRVMRTHVYIEAVVQNIHEHGIKYVYFNRPAIHHAFKHLESIVERPIQFAPVSNMRNVWREILIPRDCNAIAWTGSRMICTETAVQSWNILSSSEFLWDFSEILNTPIIPDNLRLKDNELPIL